MRPAQAKEEVNEHARGGEMSMPIGRRFPDLPGIVSSHWPILFCPSHKPESDDGAKEPEDTAQEAKCFAGPPPVAHSTVGDTAPAESPTTASIVAESVDEETEGRKPGSGEDEIHRPVEKAASEGEEPVMFCQHMTEACYAPEATEHIQKDLPDQAEQDREAGDDFNVNEALFGPLVGCAIAVKVGADDAGNDTCTHELSEAESRGDEAR